MSNAVTAEVVMEAIGDIVLTSERKQFVDKINNKDTFKEIIQRLFKNCTYTVHWDCFANSYK